MWRVTTWRRGRRWVGERAADKTPPYHHPMHIAVVYHCRRSMAPAGLRIPAWRSNGMPCRWTHHDSWRVRRRKRRRLDTQEIRKGVRVLTTARDTVVDVFLRQEWRTPPHPPTTRNASIQAYQRGSRELPSALVGPLNCSGVSIHSTHRIRKVVLDGFLVRSPPLPPPLLLRRQRAGERASG